MTGTDDSSGSNAPPSAKVVSASVNSKGDLEIVIRLVPIDPEVDPGGTASVSVCEAVNRLELPQEIPATELAEPEERSIKRRQRLSAMIAHSLDSSLRQLATEWLEASGSLVSGVAVKPISGAITTARDIKLAADDKLLAVLQATHELRNKYGLSDVELAKELQKKVLWAVLVYLAYLGGSS